MSLPTARCIAVLAALFAVASCRGGPDVSTGKSANPSAARGRLVAAAASGPVPLEIDSVPPVYAGGVAEVARVASQAGEWLGASFVPAPYGQGAAGTRLVMRFEEPTGTAAEICRGTAALGRLPPPPLKVHAVLCDGPVAVADVTGVAAGSDLAEADRLIKTAMDRLFPGRSGDYYYSAPGVSLGVGLGSGGGWGLGGGLHF